MNHGNILDMKYFHDQTILYAPERASYIFDKAFVHTQILFILCTVYLSSSIFLHSFNMHSMNNHNEHKRIFIADTIKCMENLKHSQPPFLQGNPWCGYLGKNFPPKKMGHRSAVERRVTIMPKSANIVIFFLGDFFVPFLDLKNHVFLFV